MNIKIKVLIILVVLLFQMIFITGCWSSREVEDLAISNLFGVDQVTENGIDKWQISIKMSNPIGQKQSVSQSDKISGVQEILWRGTGLTIEDAISDCVEHSSGIPLYGHIRAIIFGEKVAKEKIAVFIEAAMQYWEISPRIYFIVTKGEAYNILQAEPTLGVSLSKQVSQMCDRISEKHGAAVGVTLREISARILSPDRDGVLPQLKVSYPGKKDSKVTGLNKTIFLEGFGVFRGDNLVGWLDLEEARGYLFIAKKLAGENIYLPANHNGKWFTYLIVASKSKIKTQLTRGDKLKVRITIQTQGSMGDAGKDVGPEDIEWMESSAAETIRKLAIKAIDKSKEYDADYLGIIQNLHRHDLDAWQKVKSHWREIFQNAEVEVEVKSKIVNTGQLLQFRLQKH